MRALFGSFGRPLALLFATLTALWAVVFIVLPQFSMLDKALRRPVQQSDTAVIQRVMRDARTCQSVLRRQIAAADAEAEGAAAPQSDGGLMIPSISSPSSAGGGQSSAGGGLATPSIGAGAPSPSAGGSEVIQCARARTDAPLTRGDGARATIAETYNAPLLSVDATAAPEEQIAQAEAVLAALAPLLERSGAQAGLDYTGVNFEQIWAPRAIPMTAETRAAEDAEWGNQFLNLIGVRFVADDQVQLRITLATLLRTLFYAAAATVLALIVCYPIAYNLALASTGRKAVALFLALIIPYAIVEIMRIYAWVSIIENRGVLNLLLDWVGIIDLEQDEAIPFKESPLTVFTVIVYTYMLYMVFPMVSVMSTLDKNQLEAGRDLGASVWRVHRRIIIPHAKPGVVVGVVTTFMLCAGAFSVPQIISRGRQAEWFSQTIYTRYFEAAGGENIGAAYAFAFMFVCLIIVALFMWITRSRLKDFVRS